MPESLRSTGQMPAWPKEVQEALRHALGDHRAAAVQTAVGYSRVVAICATVCPAALVAALVDDSGVALDHVRRQYWSRWLLESLGMTVSATGLEHLDPVRPRVYVPNHQSYLDIPALHWLLPADIRMVAKASIKWVPLLGQAMLAAGYPFIDRADARGSHDHLDKVAARMHDGISILMFAEGTRARDGQIGPFKKGAFILALKAGVPIVPVGIAGSFEALGRGRPFQPGHIHVHVMPEVSTAGMSVDDRDPLRDQVRNAVLEARRLAERRRVEQLEA